VPCSGEAQGRSPFRHPAGHPAGKCAPWEGGHLRPEVFWWSS